MVLVVMVILSSNLGLNLIDGTVIPMATILLFGCIVYDKEGLTFSVLKRTFVLLFTITRVVKAWWVLILCSWDSTSYITYAGILTFITVSFIKTRDVDRVISHPCPTAQFFAPLFWTFSTLMMWSHFSTSMSATGLEFTDMMKLAFRMIHLTYRPINAVSGMLVANIIITKKKTFFQRCPIWASTCCKCLSSRRAFHASCDWQLSTVSPTVAKLTIAKPFINRLSPVPVSRIARKDTQKFFCDSWIHHVVVCKTMVSVEKGSIFSPT